MRSVKPVAFILAVVILMPMLMSCRSGNKSSNVVKADDPWYETTKFEMKKDIRQYEKVKEAEICTSDDKVFSIYPLSRDMWGSARTVLDTYDFEGNLISRKEIKCPDEFFIPLVYSISSDPEGKTLKAALFLNYYGERFYAAFADIDAETGEISNIKDMLNKGNVYMNEVWEVEVIGDYSLVTTNDAIEPTESATSMLLFKNSELIGKLDTSSINPNATSSGFSLDLSRDSLFILFMEMGAANTAEFDLNTGGLKSLKSIVDSDEKTVSSLEYTPTDNGKMCKIDDLGNITEFDTSSMTSKTVVDCKWHTPLFHPFISRYRYVSSKILSCTEERTVILDFENVTYGLDDPASYDYITVLKKADKNPHAGKKVIEIAMSSYNYEVSDYLLRSITEFNRTNKEYLLRVWDKNISDYSLVDAFSKTSDGDISAYEMIQALKGDEAPDIVVGVQNTYAMRDEIFMDLTGILEPEVMEKQYENIIDAGKVNGKLYFLPVSLEIEGLVTNTKLLKDGAVGLTFDEFEKMIKDDLKGYSPYDLPNEWNFNKRTFIMSCLDTKSAIEGDKIDFGTEQFRKVIDYAKENIPYEDEMSVPPEYYCDWVHRQKSECCYGEMSCYLDFVKLCRSQKGEYVIIGTPSEDASGPRFKATETISVSASTDVKDGCKDFLNYLFSGSAFDSDDCEFINIVTNKEIMNRNIETLEKLNNEDFKRFRASVESGAVIPAAGLETAYGAKYSTDEMRKSFLTSMSTISTYYYEDPEITRFIFEEIAPYYAGDRSMDDVIKILNDRATKYIREM